MDNMKIALIFIEHLEIFATYNLGYIIDTKFKMKKEITNFTLNYRKIFYKSFNLFFIFQRCISELIIIFNQNIKIKSYSIYSYQTESKIHLNNHHKQ